MCPPGPSSSNRLAPSASPRSSSSRPAILRRLTDAHCHPTDRHAYKLENQKDAFASLELARICAMSSNLDNQRLVRDITAAYSDQVIPCYGVHPWFVHPISIGSPPPPKAEHYATLLLNTPQTKELDICPLLATLPDPVGLDEFLASLRRDLLSHPRAMLGEVGLDKAFKIPLPPPSEQDGENEKPGGIKLTSPLRTSPLATPIEHQVALLKAQIVLAVELRRNVSFHSVRAPQDTVEFLKMIAMEVGEEFERIHVCLHSFGGSAQTAQMIQKAHPNVFFSFSTAISGRSPRFYDLLRSIDPSRLLVESDYPDVRNMDEQVWDVFEAIMEARGWEEEETVRLLEENWKRFEEEGVPCVGKEKTKRGGKGRKKKVEGKEERKRVEEQSLADGEAVK